MADLDAVALSSLNEGTPVALIEALASVTPVVATGVGGVCFVVEDGVTGLLVPKANPIALADGLRRVLGNRTEADAMAAAGRRDVMARFGSARLVRDIRDLYCELVGA
jgi:glycosyltransferase involved in cell wall biosynthesis